MNRLENDISRLLYKLQTLQSVSRVVRSNSNVVEANVVASFKKKNKKQPF